MATGTEYDRLITTQAEEKKFHRGRTTMEITEMICKAMEEHGVNRTELARRLGTTKGSVTQMLNGDRNLTLKSISDILFELGQALVATYRGINEPVYREVPVGSIQNNWSTEEGYSNPKIKLVRHYREAA